MYLGPAESFEEGFTWLHPPPSPFCSHWASLLQDSVCKFPSCYTCDEPETDVMLCVNYTQIKEIIKGEKRKNPVEKNL